MTSHVLAVHLNAEHAFSKRAVPSIELVSGHGVKGDAHFGTTVKHRSRVARDPTQPNLRQIHLLHQELLTWLDSIGLPVKPGEMGENVTTYGLDILSLSRGAKLQIGAQAVIEITGLRDPCGQIESFMPGLLAAVMHRDSDGTVLRKAGVMGIVINGGLVVPGDPIAVVHTPVASAPLEPV